MYKKILPGILPGSCFICRLHSASFKYGRFTIL